MRILQLAVLLVVFALGAVSAQQADPTKPLPPAKPTPPRSPTYPTPAPVVNPPAKPPQYGVIGPSANFTGLTGTLDPAGYTLGRRVFEPGTRNATWHMHTAGQLVFAEAGRGRLQIQGQPIQELAVGDSAYIPGGTYHWHGAAPTERFTMMFITMGQSKTSQGEKVTEEVYLGKVESRK
jgi:quercetin dioxygenase-like cupin family protein